MNRLDPGSVALSLLLSALATLASFATDMGLPVLGATAASLGVTPGRAALTLSVFMAGFAVGPLVVGPLSDHHGRRPLLLAGCATFAACGALAALSTTLGALLLWRTLMGIGAGACQVLVVAMVRDLFAGPEARVRQSYVNLAAGLAPVIAPSLGVVVAAVGGWRAIYAFLAAGGLVLLVVAARRLGESAPRRVAASLTLRAALGHYVRVARQPVTVGYVLVQALNFGALFAYVSGSSLVLINLLHVGQRTYGILFACTALGLMAGALLNAQLTRRGIGHGPLIEAGLAAIVGSALVLLALTLTGALSVAALVPLAVVGMVGQGLVRPHTAQGALEPLPEIAGVASAVLSAVQMVAGALASAAVAMLFNGTTALAMTAPMSACALAAALVYVAGVRRHDASLNPPPIPERASMRGTAYLVAALSIGFVPAALLAQQPPASAPLVVGNPLGLPVTPAPDGAFGAISPNVKVYGAIYSAESCSYDAERGVIVVPNRGVPQNVQANDAFVSFINHDGSVHTARWIGVQSAADRGKLTPPLVLNEPYGSDIANGMLYVADRDGGTSAAVPSEAVIRRFDMRTGAPAGELRVPGVDWINDIEVANDGTVYATRTGAFGDNPDATTWQVWKIAPTGAASVFVQGAPLFQPNGIAFDPQGNVVVVNIGDANVLTFAPDGRLLKTEQAAQAGNDGLVIMPDGTKYVSSVRNGGISRVRPGKPAELIARNIPSAASMCYDAGANQLVIPMNANNALAFVKIQ